MNDIAGAINVMGQYIYIKNEFDLDEKVIVKMSLHFNIRLELLKNLLNAAFSIVKAPSNLAGILLCRPALDTLINQILSSSTLPQIEKESLGKILDLWFKLSEDSPGEKIYRKKVPIEESPFYAFYTQAHGAGGKPDSKVTPLYSNFCLFFCKAVKEVFLYGLDEDTNKEYARAFRYFFVYMPEEIKFQQNHSFDDLGKYILAAIWGYDRKKNGNSTEELSEAAKRYRSILTGVLIEKRKKHPQSHGSLERHYSHLGSDAGVAEITIPTFEHVYDNVKILNPNDDNTPDKITITSINIPSSSALIREIDEEEAADDEIINMDLFYCPDHDPSDKAIPRKPFLNHIWKDLLHLRYYTFFWDSKYANLYHFSILQKHIDETSSRASKKETAIKVFLLLLMHTGIAPESLLQMCTLGEEEEPATFEDYPAFIRKIDRRYYIFKPSPVNYKSEQECGGIYRDVNRMVRVPLSLSITEYIDKSDLNKSMRGFFFSLKPPYRSTAINLDNINDFLGAINKERRLGLTAHKIALSFFPLYSIRYGLDPIKACYISGQHHRLFSSQLHYIHLRADQLEDEYLNTSEAVWKNIRKNESFLDRKNKMSNLITNNKQKLIKKPSYGYGSPFVPDKDKVVSYTEELKGRIQKMGWDEITMRHNLYMIYTYLCMQFSFAYRPRNSIPYRFSEFARDEYEIINDKLSHIYREERILPPSDILESLAEEIRDNFKRVKMYLAKRINPAMLRFSPSEFYFFLSEKGDSEDFNLKRLKDYLSIASLPYPFVLKMPRHFVRTYFYERGTCHDMADCWLGHHHICKEPLGISSSLIYKDVASLGLDIINTMLQEIGFTPIPYAPEDNGLY